MGQSPTLESRGPGNPLTGERHVLEMLATGVELQIVLDELCQVIDQQSGLASSVYLLDRDRKYLTLAAGPHLPEAWREATRTFAVSPTNGSCGAAIYQRAPVIVTDVAASPLYVDYRDVARETGTNTLWSTPLFSKDGETLGTLCMANRKLESPDEAQVALVGRAAHLASIAVERHRVEQALRESERRFSSAFYASPDCMAIASAASGRLLYVNDAFTRLFGYSRAEAVGQTALGLGIYANPEDRPRIVQLFAGPSLRDVELKMRTKSGNVIDISLSMERVELLGEEGVLAIATDITERTRTEQQLRASEQLLRQVLDASPVGVTVMDSKGNVILTNPAAIRVWGRVLESAGERYARSQAWWHDTGVRIAPGEWASVRALTKGETTVNEVLDIEALDGVRKIIQNSAVPMRDAGGSIVGAVVINEDISARKAAERERDASLEQMRALTARLMRAQDGERRRIAQMLHETTAQDLAGLKMLLGRLQRTLDGLPDAERALLDESIGLADRSMAGVRTLSYLLYPPFLDENGLLSALRWYAGGFAGRSGIAVTLDLPPALDRLRQDVETALFRVVQEALINIHRHAGSPTARIGLRVEAGELTLDIADDGRGIPPEILRQLRGSGGGLGVGIGGMRERLTQLGGTLDVESDESGTKVRARIRLERTTE